jgi:dolichyl-phosphate-mannose--protein O-mannosyl transferase
VPPPPAGATATPAADLPWTRRDGAWFVGIVLAALLVLLFRIGVPATHVLDEAHYVPAAQGVLEALTDRNYEHPPLGKLLIAAGLALFGDDPLGWRFMSVVFGASTLGAIYLWARALFAERRAALMTVALSAVNHHVYVMSRVAMLDGFMVAFMVGGLAAWSWAARAAPDRRAAWMALAGALLGLSAAAKWSGLFALGWVGCLALLAGEWRRPVRLLVTLGVLPAVCYFATFLPLFCAPDGPAFSFAELWAMQARMLAGQLHVGTDHPYNAGWWTWPLMLRPMWFAFDPEPTPGYVRGVFMVGNPLLMWGGLLFLARTAVAWLREGSAVARHITLGFLFMYLPWILVPRGVWYYYYYYPAALLLGFAASAVFLERRRTADAAQRARWGRLEWSWLVLCVDVFVWFYPFLAALPMNGDLLRLWAWFERWI